MNPPKRAKHLNSHYSPILHGCTNTRKVKAKFKNFLILLESGFSPNTLFGIWLKKLAPKKYALMHWHTHAGNITTNINVKVDFTLPSLIAMNAVTWNCHVDDFAKGR